MKQAGELGSLAEALYLRLVIIFRLHRTGRMIIGASRVQPSHSVFYRIERRGRNSVPCVCCFSGEDQLVISIKCRPSPNIASALWGSLWGRDVFCLGVNDAPNLIALYALALHVAAGAIVKLSTRDFRIVE